MIVWTWFVCFWIWPTRCLSWTLRFSTRIKRCFSSKKLSGPLVYIIDAAFAGNNELGPLTRSKAEVKKEWSYTSIFPYAFKACKGTYLPLAQTLLTKLHILSDDRDTSGSQVSVYVKQTLIISKKLHWSRHCHTVRASFTCKWKCLNETKWKTHTLCISIVL
jgi:hypothetical protein